MRVVFLTHNYPRAPGDIPGAFLHPLAQALIARGVDLRVVAPGDRGRGGREMLEGVPVRRVRYDTPEREELAYTGQMASALRSPRGMLTFLRLGRALRAGARAELADAGSGAALVHAHWWIPGGLAAPADVPMVLTCHGTDVRMLDRIPGAPLLARPVFRRARVVSTVSEALARSIARHTGVPVAPADVIAMPLTQVARTVSTGGGGIVVVGRLSGQKRVHLAIEAYARMRDMGYAGPLTIVGDGETREALQELRRTLGLQDVVRFTGSVPPAQVPDHLATADLMLMPAREEGFGLAAAEALLQGVPVVACRDGGGLLGLVPPTDAGRIAEPSPDAMAHAALELLADPAARLAAVIHREAMLRTLSPDAVADRCLDWYRRALA